MIENLITSDLVVATGMMMIGLFARSLLDFINARANADNVRTKAEAEAQVEKAKARQIMTETDIKGDQARVTLLAQIQEEMRAVNQLVIRQQTAIFDMSQQADKRWTEYQGTIETQQKELVMLKEQSRLMNETNKTMQDQLDEARKHVADLQKKLDEEQAAREKLAHQLEEEKSAREQLAGELAVVHEQRLQLESALKEKDQQIAELQTQLEAARGRLNALETASAT